MNGMINIESEYGMGSSFSFTIPQKVVETPEDASPENDAVSVSKCEKTVQNCSAERFVTKDTKILLVDDNEINRDVAKAMLEPLKAEISEAVNGAESVQMAEKTKYDIIFMDSHMPVMNGEEATQKIRTAETSQNRSTPIIALTADAIVGVREQLLSAGMNDYLVKPMTIVEINSMVKKYLPAGKIIGIENEQ